MAKHEGFGSAASVDIVIPCYQYGRFLRECVASALMQGIRDLRVLIVDNASTDESVEVARQLSAEDRRVQVIARARNLGLSASINEGIDWADSKYFVVLYADDLLAPGTLRRAISIMERHADVGFVYGPPAWLRPQDLMPVLDPGIADAPFRIVSGSALLERFCRTAFNHISGAVVVRTAMQKRAGYYRPELPYTDDFEMWMRLACLGHAAETEACQGIVRVHGLNRSTFGRQLRTANIPLRERERMLYNWHDEAALKSFFAHEGSLLPEASRLHGLAKRSLAERAYWAAVSNFCRGQANISKVLLSFALRRRPITAIFPPVSYLFRRHDSLSRMLAVASEMAGRSGSSWPVPGEQMKVNPWY